MATRHLPRSVHAALLAWGLCACAEPEPPPNVVLFVVDTLRADHLSLYGYERPTTPFLDQYAAAHAQVFEQAHSTAPWTKPSVATLLTGLDPRYHQVLLHPHRLHGDLFTLPEAFAEAGYDTAGIQSNILLASPFGFAQGFATYDEAHLASHDRSTGAQINAAALDWLANRRDKRLPFFLYVHHYEPHFRYLRSGERFYPGYSGRLTGEESMDQLVGATKLLEPRDVAWLAARYDAEIVYQDELFGEFWRGLEAQGLTENTILAFTADHGEEFLDHGDLSHQYKLFEELVHVPLVIGLPKGAGAGRRLPAPVSLADLPRSLLELAGVAAQDFPGRSLLPLLAGGPDPLFELVAHTMSFHGTEGPGREMLVLGHEKLMRDLESGARSLYRLDLDPLETHDLAVEQPERVQFLEGCLERWHEGQARYAREFAPETLELEPAMLQQMQDLGYF